MRSRWFILILLSTSIAFAQSNKPAQPAPSGAPAAAAPSAPPSLVPDNAAVITINGVCDPTLPNPPQATSPCKVQITKAEFDRMMTAITPPGSPAMPPAMKREKANQLAQLIAVAAAGEKSGVLNTPEGEQNLKLAKLQALANSYARQLQQNSKPTDAQLQALYDASADKYQQATIQQLFVPPLKPVEGKTADPDAQKARAEKFRERAVAGEPFDKLQKEALEGTSVQAPPPASEITVQKEKVPAARAFIFDLKAGEVSQPVTEPSGSVLYKVVSKSTLPFAQVKDTLAQQVQQQNFQSALEAVVKSATPTLNDEYFGPATPQPTLGGPVSMSPAHGATAPVPPLAPKQPK